MLLGLKKAVGCDDVLSEFIKFSADVIAQYLHYYFNFAFNFRIFSDSCKIAKAVPIHKSGSKLQMGNYQPISILTSFFKIFQKLIHQRMLTFLKTHKVLLRFLIKFFSWSLIIMAFKDHAKTLLLHYLLTEHNLCLFLDQIQTYL